MSFRRVPGLAAAFVALFGPGGCAMVGPDWTLTAYGAAFDIAWELDFRGRFRRGIKAAGAAYFASIALYDDVQMLVAP